MKAVIFKVVIVCLLLCQICKAKSYKKHESSAKALGRANTFGTFFENLALDAETNAKLPLIWRKWNEECDNKLRGLTLTPLNGNLYYFYTGAPRLNWHAARNWCTARGMDLASLETIEEVTAVTAYVSQLMGGEAGGTPADFWLGLNDLSNTVATTGIFQWPTTGLPPIYAPWFSNTVPTQTGTVNDDCGFIGKSSGAVGFGATSCATTTLNRFICELKSPCRETLLIRYYLDQKLNINNYKQTAENLFGYFNNKNFQDVLFNTNANIIG